MASSSAAEMTGADSANSDQLSEVASIKTAFPNRCRVTSDVGEFSKVVTVQPEDMDVTIKFQLPAAYPSVIPEITIRSGSLPEESIIDVRQILRSKARAMLGQQMIRPLIAEAEAQFKLLGLKPGKTNIASEHIIGDKHQQKIRKQKLKQTAEAETVNEKLPSMKTADDVVKRIIWDDALEKDDFIVGYFDRFRGLVEKSFSDFSWEDLASVDYDVLAVPKHRIQYFKYKKVKVWDKTKRIDNVFGSADGTKTIDVVIKELQELERLGQTDSSLSSRLQNKSSDENSTSDDDSENEDSIVVVTNSSAKEKHPRGDSSASHHSKYEQDSQAMRKPNYRDNKRPNHFLCVRITSQEIRDKIGNLQDVLIEKESLYSECCIPTAALHITLCTLGLDTPEHILQCIEALKNIEPALQAAVPKCELQLNGVSHFSHQVLYSRIEHSQDLFDFCHLLKHLLGKAGVEIRDGFDFVPHVTIMKTTRPVARSLGSRYISPELYVHDKNIHFGEQRVTNVNLCCIGKERREDGFYVTPHEIHF